ncbi:unnamed protein product [Owenia fusiformis]|uniref:G-protein coupled receptors family 1 profile domain-containing protein n=1 Tax=Owenia fusiformis TaxID=6347 RepID=A0A8S4NNV2_OWEFU|nr:unnamed protein product [Owenia fusiformis]
MIPTMTPTGYNNTGVTFLYEEFTNISLTNSTIKDNDKETYLLAYRISQYIALYFLPILGIVGLIGNILSFIVFVTSFLSKLSSSVYLAALAVSDSGFLITVIIMNWLPYVNVQIIHKPAICQITLFVSSVCGFLSVWYVVGFTVERYIAVCYPMKRNFMCTTKRAKIVVISLGIYAIVSYSYMLWMHMVIGNQCVLIPIHIPAFSIFQYIDIFTTLIIPTLALFIMNSRISFQIIYFFKERKVLTQAVRTSIKKPKSWNTQDSSRLAQMKITKMLLVVSTVFLLLNLPAHAIRLQATLIQVLKIRTGSHLESVLQGYFQLLFYLNFGINFFLYSFCGKNFRLATTKMFRNTYHNLCQRKIRERYSLVTRWGNTNNRHDTSPPQGSSTRNTLTTESNHPQNAFNMGTMYFNGKSYSVKSHKYHRNSSELI